MTDGLRIRVRGQVQGVGFRPFVWQLARRFGVTGNVLNDPEGVLIHACTDTPDAFIAALDDDAPPLSRVDAVEVEHFAFREPPTRFDIVQSEGSGAETRVTPDAATCAACIADIEGDDPRRRGYAFTNCTHCGPRFTILHSLPYDRARTTMAPFKMCPACAREYADPADRRFHAQPVACSDCGPSVWFEDGAGRVPDGIATAAERLGRGAILAVKGLGGFHLCCDATNPVAVAELRRRKHRPGKPFALMGRVQEIARYADATDVDWRALRDPSAPIVLLHKETALPDEVAPNQPRLGWMLPYTPLHHLLLGAVERPLVMTSGNLSGEPQVIGNDEAREKLNQLVDGYLMHDRDIARRLDDSVLRNTAYGPMILRRARGQVPETLPLPDGFDDAPQVVAFGAHLKSAICLIKNGQALLSHHLGDLDDALTWDEFVRADTDYADLFDHVPSIFACDLHPEYRSSQHARVRAQGSRLIDIQHHHAHLAACMVENGWAVDAGPVAGIVLDGLGLGSDGTIWGGELLLGDYAGFERVAHLAPAPLPGGDAANREPWRNLLARLDRAGMPDVAEMLLPHAPHALMRQSIAAQMNAPLSSSAGRLFDAFATALGFEAAQTFEGEAAMWLEALALCAPSESIDAAYTFGLDAMGGALDDAPLWSAWHKDYVQGAAPAVMAWRFHAGLAVSFARRARRLVETGKAKAVALSGGCYQNALLLDLTIQALGDVPVLLHHKVPANDGGLALGQAAIAAAQAVCDR